MPSAAVQMSLTIEGDKGLFERVPKRLRNPRALMKQIGVLGFSSATHRLTQVLRQGDGLRTGRLMASIAVVTDAKAKTVTYGSGDTVFELGDTQVVVGTNVPYAAQVHFGGRIEPREARALAIPLVDQLKRDGRGPSELDPNRDVLRFQPHIGGATGNVIGLLIDDEGDLGFGEDVPLFAIATHVDQEAKPYLFWSDEDIDEIHETLVPLHLGEEGT